MTYTYRPTTLADAKMIADHRYLMFAEMGMDTDMLAKARLRYLPWLQKRLENGVYTGIFVEHEGQVIGGAGMWISESAPSPTVQSTNNRRANIVNVYTYPDHRRQGLARDLMTRLIAIAKEGDYPAILLHASDAGRTLYESLGFQDTNELRLLL